MDIEKILIAKEAKVNFIKGLIRIAKCDGVQADEEVVFFQKAAQALGLEKEDMIELDQCWEKDEKIVVKFETNVEKMFFFIQAIQLCWVDNEYTNAEKQEIQSIANELGISAVALQTVENWAYEGIQWNRRGDDLLKLS